MSAALQCLSNTEPLTRYLMEEEWQTKINPVLTNSGGKLVIEYYKLLYQMWCETQEYISPSEIKKAITKSNKTFIGYSQ